MAKDPLATAANPLPLQSIWDISDGDVSNGVTKPWYFMNNTIADASVARTVNLGPPTDQIVLAGQTNDFQGPLTEGPHQFGIMVHQFVSAPPTGPIFLYENSGASPNQLTRPILSVAAGNVMDSDPRPDTGYDFSGTDLVLSGISETRVCNGSLLCSQTITAHDRVQFVMLADVLHNDGVLELVLGTSNKPFFTSPATDMTGYPFTGGRLLIYEHEVIGDMGTNFVFDPTNATTPRGAIIELGPTTSVTGLASLATTSPIGVIQAIITATAKLTPSTTQFGETRSAQRPICEPTATTRVQAPTRLTTPTSLRGKIISVHRVPEPVALAAVVPRNLPL